MAIAKVVGFSECLIADVDVLFTNVSAPIEATLSMCGDLPLYLCVYYLVVTFYLFGNAGRKINRLL